MSPEPASPAPDPAAAPAPARRGAPRPGTVRGPWRGLPTAVPAAVTLVVGFAVAQATGVRALGGALLVVGVAWCAWRAQPVGTGRVALVVALGLVCFVAAHVLAGALGAWPAVLLAAAVLAAGTWSLVDAPARRRPPGTPT